MRLHLRKLVICPVVLCILACSAREAGAGCSWDKARWLREAFATVVSGAFPRLAALSYWHETFPQSDGAIASLSIHSSPRSLAAFQEGAANPLFVDESEYFFSQGGAKVVPLSGRILLAAFPDFGASEDVVSLGRIWAYEELARRKIAWAYFSNNWFEGVRFPTEEVKVVSAAGRTPFIRLMMRGTQDGGADPQHTLQLLLDGRWDAELARWAGQARDTRVPLMIEFGTEVNGDWFPWSGRWNGAGTKAGFGDPSRADGPERFREGFRRLVTLFRAHGATNVTWVFHVNATSHPDQSWNRISEYYPGDDVVDWLGVSIYGPQHPSESQCASFRDLLAPAYVELAALSSTKPIAVLEWGVSEPSEAPGRQSRRVRPSMAASRR